MIIVSAFLFCHVGLIQFLTDCIAQLRRLLLAINGQNAIADLIKNRLVSCSKFIPCLARIH